MGLWVDEEEFAGPAFAEDVAGAGDVGCEGDDDDAIPVGTETGEGAAFASVVRGLGSKQITSNE